VRLDRSKQSSSLRSFEFNVVDFFLRDPEVSQNLLVGNALVTLRRFARFPKRFFCHDWRSSNTMSAISIAAMFYGDDLDGVAKVMEADAVIPDTETEFRRFDIMEPLDIAFAAR